MTDMTVADVRAMWIKAMASGEYNHTKGAWRKSDSEFCAIGVLRKLAIEHHVIEQFEIEHGSTMPEAVYSWAGLEVCGPTERSSGHIIRVNDDESGEGDFGPVIQFIENMPLPE